MNRRQNYEPPPSHFERKQNYAIRDLVLHPLAQDATTILTINVSPDISSFSQEQIDRFLSATFLTIESDVRQMSLRAVKKMPKCARMRFIVIPEDEIHDASSDREYALKNLHFHCIIFEPRMNRYESDEFSRMRLRMKVEKHARRLFDERDLSNFYVQKMPAESDQRERAIRYQFKNQYKTDSLMQIRTESDFLH